VLGRFGFHVRIYPFIWILVPGIWDLLPLAFTSDLGFGIWSLLPSAASMAENNPGGLIDRDSAAHTRVAHEENP
jgi:hypothetical protein